MRRFRTLLGCLLAFTGQAALSLILTADTIAAPIQDKRTDPSAPQNSKDPFKGGMFGNGRATDGTLLGIESFDTPNGQHVGVTTGRFSSSEAAQKHLRQSIAGATTMLKDEPFKDKSGNVVGQRVVAHFEKTEKHQDFYVVTWTNGPEYYRVASKDLATALDEEKERNTAQDKAPSKGSTE